ncbi:hypothetical protein F5050DRAFT_1709028 [Lentinula boryana]|uniref:Zn(2)-C6 fungal-type domain-containing protein n=1 Tax=Lentinula boryana TaxID=40481 RepID=A0ABQ8QPY2_9AGAR|nr:hypothetical protein F5050DRAFT_1709028 [Lentinula boryana]
MSSTQMITETTQEHRARLLHIQAERQQAREAEAARQEAEFAAEMERLEEEAAREAEEKRLAEEKKQEEARIAEEQRIEREKREEAERVIRARDKALEHYAREQQKEKDRAAKELAERRERAATAASCWIGTMMPREPLGSTKKMYKSASLVRDNSDEEVTPVATLRGVKCKRMTAQIGRTPLPEDDDPNSGDNDDEPPSPPRLREPCVRCTTQGKASQCLPQPGHPKAHACAVCHRQRQRCSWSGDNALRRSQSKQTRVEEPVYLGEARRIAEKKFGGVEFGEKLDELAWRIGVLEWFASCSTMVLEQIGGILE